MTAEELRLQESDERSAHWKRWGPYVSERAWGTVREDYSPDGTAWEYFPHDHARSRVYRWNEDGIAGICDRHQYICFALAMWNGRDPILKERLFGLTGNQGNHGEDVKECYFYVDNTPTHSYMKYLYKYPQHRYPYTHLVEETGRRTRKDPEYHLIDTGIFDDNRYFDVFVEYAKGSPEDICIQITVENRGPDAAVLDLLPTVWYRNTWSWAPGQTKPNLRAEGGRVVLDEPHYGRRVLEFEGQPELLFTENETNYERIFNAKSACPYQKDAFHRVRDRGRKGSGEPGADRHESGAALSPPDRSRQERDDSAPPSRSSSRPMAVWAMTSIWW